MTSMPTLTEMLKAGAHFGHQRSRWHPKMKPYIFGLRNGIHIIDLEKTQEELAKALQYAHNLAAEGKMILFVGTKRQARDIIKAAAEKCGMPYLVERWIGGLLTNFDEFKRRMKKYLTLTEQVRTGEIEKYTKKEQLDFKKQLVKMDKYLNGLVPLERLPDALYLADIRVEKTALTEAIRRHITVVAVCDTNVNPTKVSYPIPANDDAINSIRLIADLMADAINEGKAAGEKQRAARVEIEKLTVKETGVASAPAMAPARSGTPVEPKKERRELRKEESV